MVLDGRVLWVLLAPVTPIHLTLYMFPETVSLLCMWYSTAAVVPDFVTFDAVLEMVLASVTTFVLKPLLFPETLSPSMPCSGWSWQPLC